MKRKSVFLFLCSTGTCQAPQSTQLTKPGVFNGGLPPPQSAMVQSPQFTADLCDRSLLSEIMYTGPSFRVRLALYFCTRTEKIQPKLH